MQNRRLWIALGAVLVVSFSVLGWFGHEIYQKAPPIPARVVTSEGKVLFTAADIRDGQSVWQSFGGQEVGTVWGHGAYVAPDWTADWVHREATWLLDHWADAEQKKPWAALPAEAKAALQARLQGEVRRNAWDPATGDLVVSPLRAESIAAVGSHYDRLFGSDPSLDDLRKSYALPANALPDAARRQRLQAFFFWASWACTTERPGGDFSYTNNWPPDEFVGNRPTPRIILWSVISVIGLLAGIGALAWYFASRREEAPLAPPEVDPLLALSPTPSMGATLKYFWVVTSLILAQVGFGVVAAHYGVEGHGFYGLPLADWLPYSVVRTWHVQSGLFWIATAWLAAGLFVAPAVSGVEPRFQRAGVNFLFACLLVIVGGSLAGEWLGVFQKLGLKANFWFGHQGYEYVDLGRFWQIFLFVGLLLWFVLVVRALLPALRKPSPDRQLLVLFVFAAGAIGLFYGAGLMWGRHTHLAIAEYWRWWVVHLWVEGFFEVFSTVVIAFLFTRLGLLRASTATTASLFTAIIYLAGGVIGTFHHLYFAGTPTPILALGATFSALEVVPLTLAGFEAVEHLRRGAGRPWLVHYRWPILFFVAVAFWNLVGAGLFGFLINTPIALYYMQGLNTTPVHGHTALFGVYGMLGIGLMLFALRGLSARATWKPGLVKAAFWSLNIGLALMVLLSLLPVGLAQTWASVEHGMWYARSAEFLQGPALSVFRWLRVIGDSVFGLGALALAAFVFGLKGGWSVEKTPRTD
jgi:nitric oxide reductase subunit B